MPDMNYICVNKKLMKEISYITDAENHKTAVVLDIKTLDNHTEEVQDLLDGLIAESRKKEDKTPLSIMIKNFKKTGKLS